MPALRLRRDSAPSRLQEPVHQLRFRLPARRLFRLEGGPVGTPRIRPRDPGEVAPEVENVFETYLRERGNIPNMFRTVGVRPQHLTTMIAHFRAVMNEGEVPRLLKELLAIRVSSLNRCKY